MAAQYKTQCPHCQAQFRIGEQHLKQAKGQVRCGSCLQVFLATEHLVKETPARPATPPSRKPAPRPAAAKPTAKPAAKPAAAPPEKWALPQEEPPAQQASRWSMDDGLADDFAPPREDNNSATPGNNDTKVSLGAIELSDSFLSLDGEDNERLRDENFSDMAGAGRGEQSETSDEAWAEKLLEELDEELPAAAPDEPRAKPGATRSNTPRNQTASARPAAEPNQDEPDWAHDAGDSLFEEQDDHFGLMDEDSNDDELAAIELPKAEKKSVAERIPIQALVSNTVEIVRWSALSLLLVVLLAIQYLAFNFDSLARMPVWRDFYATVCGAFPCTLPSLSDISKIHGSNLVVRQHPEYPSALVVDVLLFNTADYRQPFPALELGFTSLQGAPVAGRRFKPAEYLRGEMQNLELMPVDTPVHVSLDILDPGANAVNYTLRFFPPATSRPG